MWRHYYQNTDALLFVIDSNDRERIDDCRDELRRFLAEDELKDCVVLIMANKQDLPNAMSVDAIRDKLQLDELKNKTCCKFCHHYYELKNGLVICNSTDCLFLHIAVVQGSCATTGEGLYDGLDWLHGQLTGKAMKESMSKLLTETGDSLRKTGLFSSIYNSLSSYWPITASTSP